MTEPQDALAGKLREEYGNEFSNQHGLIAAAPEEIALFVSTHFAEEIAKVRADVDAYSAENFMLKEQAEERSNAIDTYIRVHLANKEKITTLTSENERLKRVRAGLTRENIAAAFYRNDPHWDLDTDRRDWALLGADAILALLAPEGQG